jgi:hypothetical protein
MSMFLFDPFLWTEKLIAIAILLQALELVQARKVFSDEGVWRWQTLRGAFQEYPAMLRYFLDWCLRYKNFLFLLWSQIFCSLLLLFFSSPILLIILLFNTLLIAFRWRGSFNGGSDYMTAIILLALSVASIWKENTSLQFICFGYIAVQSVLSYFIAGIVKLRNAQWWTGRVLQAFLQSESYIVPEPVKNLSRNSLLCCCASWLIIGFECSAPFALIDSRVCAIFIVGGIFFHLLNVYIFGLNRFLFAWLASYPALLMASAILTKSFI